MANTRDPQPDDLVTTGESLTMNEAAGLSNDRRVPSPKPTYEELLARVAQLEQQQRAFLREGAQEKEAALRQREERHRLALAAGGMATWDWHVPSGEVVWNDEHFRMLGYEPGSIAPGYQAWADRVHTEDRAATEKLVQANVEQGGEYRSEFRALLADGTVRWIEARGRTERDEAGQPLRQYGVMLDITERKRAEDVLRRYEMLAGHSRDIVLFMRSEDGRILEANAAAPNAYGYSREEMLSLSIRDLRSPDSTLLTNEQMAIADAGGILFETVHRRKDGSTFPVEVSSRGATMDGLDAADSLSEALELSGHRVAVAYDGETGLAKAREVQPEIVLCDIGLPRMDGYSVARALRQEAATASAYLVALTGYAQPEDQRRALGAGFDATLLSRPTWRPWRCS